MRIGPLSSVDAAFAWDEGEGDRTLVSWLHDHEAFFRRFLPTIGLQFDPDMPTVFERFDVLYSEQVAADRKGSGPYTTREAPQDSGSSGCNGVVLARGQPVTNGR
jgi:hypothetical protein